MRRHPVRRTVVRRIGTAASLEDGRTGPFPAPGRRGAAGRVARVRPADARSGPGRSWILTAAVDETTLPDETEALEASPPSGDRARDQRIILGNTGQNVLGLAIGALATFAAQVIMTNTLGDQGFGVVTLTTQFAFIAAAATRFGMDVANVRLVAILVGRGQAARSRGLVRRAAGIATAVSVPFAIAALAVSPWLAETFSGLPGIAEPAFRAAAVTVPLAALAFTY